jgi:hypothetical protein
MSDTAFFSRRAWQELEAAIATDHVRARQIHLELADAYSLKLLDAACAASEPIEVRPSASFEFDIVERARNVPVYAAEVG